MPVDLEAMLQDLGPVLDAPDGEGLSSRVVGELRRPISTARRRRVALLLLAATIGVVGAPASRSAIARWFGVGAVVIRNDTSTQTHLGSGVSSTSDTNRNEVQRRLAKIKSEVSFKLVVAGPLGGALTDARLDRSVGDGIVVLSYPTFVLTELASSSDIPPQIVKLVTPQDSVRSVQVNGHPGYWVTGTNHRVSFLDRQGRVVIDKVRRAGPTLLWEADGVTLRIEGLAHQREALAVARELR